MANLTKRKLQGFKRQILDLMFKGTQPLEIQKQIGLEDDQDAFKECLSLVMDELAAEITNKPVERVYAELFIQGTAAIQELSDIKSFDKTADKISAIKEKWNIRKELLKVARDLGIVESGATGDGTSSVYINFINGLSSGEIRETVRLQAKALDRLHSEDGEMSILEVETPKVFTGPSANDLEAPEDDT